MSERKRCPSCGENFQRGRIVWLITRTGMARVRCCQRCADGGETVVRDRSAEATRCEHCGDRPASVCFGCLESAMLKKVAGAR